MPTRRPSRLAEYAAAKMTQIDTSLDSQLQLSTAQPINGYDGGDVGFSVDGQLQRSDVQPIGRGDSGVDGLLSDSARQLSTRQPTSDVKGLQGLADASVEWGFSAAAALAAAAQQCVP